MKQHKFTRNPTPSPRSAFHTCIEGKLGDFIYLSQMFWLTHKHPYCTHMAPQTRDCDAVPSSIAQIRSGVMWCRLPAKKKREARGKCLPCYIIWSEVRRWCILLYFLFSLDLLVSKGVQGMDDSHTKTCWAYSMGSTKQTVQESNMYTHFWWWSWLLKPKFISNHSIT